MTTHLLAQFLVRLYGWLLRLYAPRFRDEFGPEMTDVFRQAAENAARGGFLSLFALVFRELYGLPRALLSQREWKGYAMMDQNLASSLPAPAAPVPLGQVVLGLLPLVALGLGMTLMEIPTSKDELFIRTISFTGPYVVVLIGLLWGWLKGFPRWVYPCLVYGIVFAVYLSFAATPGLVIFNIPMWNDEAWGLRSFVPLALVIAVALLLSRPTWGPVKKMIQDIWNDWTLFAYGLYGLLPLVIPIMLDETGRSYRFPITAIAAIIMVTGAALYLGLAKSRLRTTAMLAGAFLSILAASIGSSLYWKTHSIDIFTDERQLIAGPIPWGSIVFPSIFSSAMCILSLLLIPGLIGIAHWYILKHQPESTGADV